MAAAADIEHPQLHQHQPRLTSESNPRNASPWKAPFVAHKYHNYPVPPPCHPYHPPPAHSESRCTPHYGSARTASPAIRPHAVLRPDSAAYVDPRLETSCFQHPTIHHHARHQSLHVAKAPPRCHSPWTDPGPSAQSRRQSIQPLEIRSWQGDWRDPEKESISLPSPSAALNRDVVLVRSTYSDSDIESFVSTTHVNPPTQKHKDTTLNVLLKLSTISPIVSFACLLYTLPILFFLAITSPLGLCFSKSSAFNNRTLRYLSPPYNLQRALVHLPICTPPVVGDAAILPTDHTSYTTLKPPSFANPNILITIQVLSPFIAAALMLISWVVASFWVLNALIQDDAVEKKTGDDDGKAYAKKVVKWWQSWLDGLILDGAKKGSSSIASGSSGESRSTRPEMRERH